jgi:hypothetical protein
MQGQAEPTFENISDF